MWEHNRGETRAHTDSPPSPADHNASGFVIQSSFYALLPAMFCRLAVELFFFYCHLWIGSQLIYSQRVTGKHPTCYFGSAQIIIITAVMMEGTAAVAAAVSEGFSSLLKAAKTQSLFASLVTTENLLFAIVNSPANAIPCFAGPFLLKCTSSHSPV